MNTIGTPYRASNKINVTLLLPSLLFLGIPLALLVGYLYSVITLFNPFSVLNLLILVLTAIFLVIALIYVIQNTSQSRSILMNILIAAVLCVTTYYSQWSYFIAYKHPELSYWQALANPAETLSAVLQWVQHGKILFLGFRPDGPGISGLFLTLCYLLELFIFLLPIAVTHMPNVFCETCKRYNFSFKFYADGQPNTVEKFRKAPGGQFGFLRNVPIKRATKDMLAALPASTSQTDILEMTYCACLKCQQNAFLSVSLLHYQRRPKNGMMVVKNIEPQFHSIAIDDATNHTFRLLLEESQTIHSSGKTH